MKQTHFKVTLLSTVCILLFASFNLTTSCTIKERNPFRLNQIHIAALILARGGSKGIKLKNLATLNGKTLLAISLQEILKVPEFQSIWVSTDNVDIFNEAVKSNPLVNVHWRSKESATDVASSIFAVQEFMAWRPELNVVALVQCTSPFVHHRYLKEAAVLIVQNNVDCVFSVTRSFKLRWTTKQNKISSLNFDPSKRPRRQDWDGELVENGMFYFAKRNLLEKGVFQNQNCKFIEIPEHHALEIDSEYHLQLAQHLTKI